MFLVDTNILLRSLQPQHPMHSAAVTAVENLLESGRELCLVPQVIYEFWNVCTRPVLNNGLGLSPPEADIELRKLESQLPVLPDNATIHETWRRLVVTHGVCGVKVHDARLVSAMITHGIGHILTFNDRDFLRYPNITAVNPHQLPRTPGLNR